MIAWEKISGDEGYRTTKEMFETLYVKKQMSIQKLTERFGCSVHAIREQLHKNGIPIRKKGGAPNTTHPLQGITLDDFKKNGARFYATQFNLDVTTVYKYFKRLEAAEKATSGSNPAPSVEEPRP